jgi:alkanesulfonate monooxygenase SsuD/methylene tetrahydromethanopterin reductase-like flavin-dependent oxidoreductase (luciferase family)
MRFDDGATRVARLAEAVEVLDGLLRGNHLVFSGEHYRLGDHRPWPPAAQHPRSPILVGGSGRQRR